MTTIDNQEREARDAHVAQNIQEVQQWIDRNFAKDIINLLPGDKKTFTEGWNRAVYTPEQLLAFAAQGDNFGLMLRDYAAIDIEASEYGDRIFETVIRLLPGAPVRRRPGSQSRAVLVALAEPVGPWNIPTPDGVDSESVFLVQGLATGQLHIIGTRADCGNTRLEWDNLCSPFMPFVTNEQFQNIGAEIARALREDGIDAGVNTGRPAGVSGEGTAETLPIDMLAEVVRAIPRDAYFYAREQRINMMYAISGASGHSFEGRELWLEWDAQENDIGPPSKPGPAAKQWDRIHADEIRLGAGYLVGQLERLNIWDVRDRAKVEMLADLLLVDEQEPQDPTAPNPYYDASFWIGEKKGVPAQALVKNLITAHGLTFIAGQPNAGKSAVAVNLAVALATGAPFAGRKTVTPSGKGCAVIYVAAESPGSIPSRFDVTKQMMLVEDGEILPIRIMPRVPNLTDKRARALFIDALKRVVAQTEIHFQMKVGAIIVDTFSRAFAMTDENSAAEANAVISALDELGGAFDAARIVVHHLGKNTSAGMRGSSALHASADDELWMTVGEEGEKRFEGVMKHEKSRNFPVGAEFEYRLKSVVVGIDEDGDEITSVCAAFSGASVAQTDSADARNKHEHEDRMAALRHDFMHYAFENGSITRAQAMGEMGMTRYQFTECFKYLRDKLKLVMEDPSSNGWVLTAAGMRSVREAKRRRRQRDEAFEKGTNSSENGQEVQKDKL